MPPVTWQVQNHKCFAADGQTRQITLQKNQEICDSECPWILSGDISP